MRGESVRRLELVDMFILDLDNEGPTECKAKIVILVQGKTNQFAQRNLKPVSRICIVQSVL
jgi:hypothetical protein